MSKPTRGRMRCAAAAIAVLLTAGAEPGRADDAEPEYAGKPVSWWVDQSLKDPTRAVGREALRVIGTPALPALARALSRTDGVARMQVLQSIRSIPGPVVPIEPALRRIVLSSNAEEQRAALGIYARDAEASASLVPLLRPFLASGDDATRSAALAVATQAGPQAAPLIETLVLSVRDTSPDIRRNAMRTVLAIAPKSPAVRSAVLGAVRDPAGYVAEQAARQAAEWGLDDATVEEAFRAGLSSDEVATRVAVLGVLAQQSKAPASLRPFVARGIADPNEGVRNTAIRVVAQPWARGPDTLAALVTRLADDAVAPQAMGVLPAFGVLARDAVKPLIARRLRVPDDAATEQALRAVVPFAGDELARAYADADAEGRDRILPALAAMSDATLLGSAGTWTSAFAADLARPDLSRESARLRMALLMRILDKNGDFDVIVPAVLATVSRDDPFANEDWWKRLCADARWEPRLAAVAVASSSNASRRILRAFASNGTTSEPATRRLAAAMLDREAAPDVRRAAACAVLGRPSRSGLAGGIVAPGVPREPLVALLAEALDDVDHGARLRAIAGLEALGAASAGARPRLVRNFALADLDEVRASARAVAAVSRTASASTQDAVREALDAPEAPRRAAAALALAFAGGYGPAAVPVLDGTLRAEDARSIRLSLAAAVELRGDARPLRVRIAQLAKSPAFAAEARQALDAIPE